MSKTFEVTKEFSAELAGTRVGWATVEPVPDGDSQYRVNIVAATVGEAGARTGYEKWKDDDLYNSTEFLTGVVAVHALIEDGKLDKDNGVNCGYTRFGDQRDKHLLANGVWRRDTLLTPEDWADSSQELLAQLKERLGSFGLESCYPTIYYNLNMTIGLNQHPDISPRDYAPSSEGLFLPDAELATVTESQQSIAGEIINLYDEIVSEDLLMKKRLTVFSDVSPVRIPGNFIASRHLIEHKEELIHEKMQNLYSPRGVYLPVGFRPNGRTWPYMDPTANTDQEAFGNELSALEVKSTAPANYELGREISEARLRKEYASKGRQVLYLLSLAEKKLTEDS